MANKKTTFYEYFKNWIEVYKKGAIRDVTMKKYQLSLFWVKKLVPKMRLCDINRISYQELLNKYAETDKLIQNVAKKFNLTYVDTGAMYRCVTLYMIIKNIFVFICIYVTFG